MTHRKILLGALAGAAALAAIPSVASASATCTYNQSTRSVDLRYGAADSSVTIRNGATLQYTEAGGFLRSCFSTSGVAATAANTNKFTIGAAKGFGAGSQNTIIDETNGGFPESNPNLQFFVLTGTNDRLTIKEGAGNDQVHLTEQTGGLALGPLVDLNYDGKADLRMTTSGSVVQVNAGNGNDFLDASGAQTYPVVLLGEANDDILVGGKKGDTLDGGANNDQLFAKDGVLDNVTGGSGVDKAQMDFNVDRPSGVETQSF